MPSPFPGMDPHLENPKLWKGVHDSLLYRMLEDLQPQLQPKYLAVYEGRLLLRPLDQPPNPQGFRAGWSDISIQEGTAAAPRAIAVASRPESAEVAVPEWVEEPELKIWHTYLEIRDAEGQEVVTVIELLSPWNKSPGQGQAEYREKQRAVLLSNTNLVEIDLLRSGAHTVAVPPGSRPASDYRVCIHRVARPGGFEVIRFGVRDPLPRVGIPLQAEEPDVVLDLGRAFDRMYDTGVYGRLAQCDGPADPPLNEANAAWADELLHQAGWR